VGWRTLVVGEQLHEVVILEVLDRRSDGAVCLDG
jgi:hypothetical protein